MEATKQDGNALRRNWDPGVPPDWRARDAVRLVAGETPEWADPDDVYVRKYADFLRRPPEASGGKKRRRKARPTPIAVAHELHQEDGLKRWEVEARLLAGQSDQQIAEKCDIPPVVVAVYERLFCCVRDHLASKDYLRSHFVGRACHGGFRDYEVGPFWAWNAIGGGPELLGPFIEVFHATRFADQPPRLSGKDLYLLESVRRHLDEMRNQLAGPSASPLEKLLIDRLVACHVEVLYFEAVEAQQLGGDNPKLAQFRLQRQEQANRQFLSAAKTLATVRQLQSRTVILGVVQQPVSVPSVESMVPGLINGEQLPKTSQKDKESRQAAANGTASRLNGHGRFHENRVAHLLETVGAEKQSGGDGAS